MKVASNWDLKPIYDVIATMRGTGPRIHEDQLRVCASRNLDLQSKGRPVLNGKILRLGQS